MKTGFGARLLSLGRMRNLLQVVYCGMLGSLVTLSVVVFFLLDRVEPLEAMPPWILLVLGAVLSFLTVGVCTMLPRIVLGGRGVPPNMALQLRAVVFSQILFATGIEGAGLFWAILALLLKQPLCLMGPALALAALLLQFPTTGRIEEKLGATEEQIDRELERLAESLK
ncbi:MAG: hypothetical protein V2A76_12055 [Planctomycetota bacterium]